MAKLQQRSPDAHCPIWDRRESLARLQRPGAETPVLAKTHTSNPQPLPYLGPSSLATWPGTAAGNHEIELDSFNTQFASYETRYPNAGAYGVRGATLQYYSVEQGGVHIISLTPYVDHTVGSPQYNWCVAQDVIGNLF